MVDTGILSNNTKFLSHEFEMTLCSLIKYNDIPPLTRIYTNPWHFFKRTRPFTDLWEVSMFQHLRQGTLLFQTPDPTCDLHMFFFLKEEIWLSPMTKAPTPTEMSKGQNDNTNNATKKFDYKVVADRLGTVNWSNYQFFSRTCRNFSRTIPFESSLFSWFCLHEYEHLQNDGSLPKL